MAAAAHRDSEASSQTHTEGVVNPKGRMRRTTASSLSTSMATRTAQAAAPAPARGR